MRLPGIHPPYAMPHRGTPVLDQMESVYRRMSARNAVAVSVHIGRR